MKKIEAIIRPENLEALKEALRETDHAGLTVVEAKGHGVQRGVVTTVGSKEVVVDLLPKLYITIVVNDHEVDRILDAIVRTSRSGNVGDGKVFVSAVEGVLRLRTGEKDTEAL